MTRSRWSHAARLFGAAEGRRVGWLEILLDLVVVGALLQVMRPLGASASLEAAAPPLGLGALVASIWLGSVLFSTLVDLDDFIARVLIFLQIFAVGAAAIAAPDVLRGHGAPSFALACAAACGLQAALFGRAAWAIPAAREVMGTWTLGLASAGTLCALGGALAPHWTPLVWGAAVGLLLLLPLSAPMRAFEALHGVDQRLLGERLGLATLLLLGGVAMMLLGRFAASEGGLLVYVEAIGALLLLCCLWWIYFDDVAGAQLRADRFAARVRLYGHLPLLLGLAALGATLTRFVALSPEEVAPMRLRWLLSGAVGVVLLAVAAVDSVTERRQAELSDRARVGVRITSAALAVLLAPVGAAMSCQAFLGLVALVCVGQVVFDMVMAPLEERQGADDRAESTADLARRRAEGQRVAPRPRRELGEAVRRGAPTSLRRDLYLFFLEGSWTRMFATMTLLYVVINVVFAGLYLLEPGSVSSASPGSFADAFFFSVQTMSTIGYGAMSPASPWGHAVVTVEAAVGLLGVALATGVIFAKVARPTSGALYSAVMVLNDQEGRPTLAFRVGNARGTEVVEATMSVSVLRDVITPEGHHLRRMFDLKLVRARSPIFALTWLVMHVIDEESPLASVDWSQPDRDIMSIVCTMTGLDGTYGQTVHARYLYRPEDIRVGARFVDVLSELEDGRLMIDYTRFHDTLSEEEARAPLGGGGGETGMGSRGR